MGAMTVSTLPESIRESEVCQGPDGTFYLIAASTEDLITMPRIG